MLSADRLEWCQCEGRDIETYALNIRLFVYVGGPLLVFKSFSSYFYFLRCGGDEGNWEYLSGWGFFLLTRWWKRIICEIRKSGEWGCWNGKEIHHKSKNGKSERVEGFFCLFFFYFWVKEPTKCVNWFGLELSDVSILRTPFFVWMDRPDTYSIDLWCKWDLKYEMVLFCSRLFVLEFTSTNTTYCSRSHTFS